MMSFKEYSILIGLVSSCLLVLLWAPEGSAKEGSAAAISQQSPQAVAGDVRQLLDGQDRILREVRHLNRELALLRQEYAQPGVEQVFAGVGYILGLFGVAFLLLARKKR